MNNDYWLEAKDHYLQAVSGETYSGYKRKRALKRSLPVLASFVDQNSIVSTLDLGLREIRLDRVLGTYYEGRNHMFAGDFIPIADANTEFSHKWVNLCASQLEEGIRDPILVYEYLNYYYVQEGNKRVSVMKFFHAPNIMAKVIRLIPNYEVNNLDVRIYYAFLDFYKKTDYEDIWFRNPSCFQSMIDFMDLTEDKDSYKDYLKTYYHQFRRNYKRLEGSLTETTSLTTGDVFLGYCRMFGLNLLDENSIRSRIQAVIRSILAEEVMVLDDSASYNSSLLPTMRKLKVAFAFPYSETYNGWSRDHYKSMLTIEEEYNSQINIDLIDNILNAKDPLLELRTKAEAGYDYIFLIDEGCLDIAERLAIEYPKTTFLMCSSTRSSYLVPTYYGKVYQANFLLGIYAALSCGLDEIGYVSCDMNEQIYKAMKAIQAGYNSIKPRGLIRYFESPKAISDDISYSAYYRSVEKSYLTEGTVNTYLRKKNSEEYLGYTYWQWEKFYSQIFDYLVDGSIKKLRASQKEAGNMLFFHWGIGTKVIGIHSLTGALSKASQLIFDTIIEDVASGRMNIESFCQTSDYEEWKKMNRSY